MARVVLRDIFPTKATYRPGENALIQIELYVPGPQPFHGTIRLSLSFLTRQVGEAQQEIVLPPNQATTLQVPVPLPPDDRRGYGMKALITDGDGETVAMGTTALDVLSHWTLAPRYGFLSDFPDDRDDCQATMEFLTRYHVNALQFYDWMYRHEQLVADQERYQDVLGRPLSRRTVQALIDTAHRYNIAAMAYTAVYGASAAFWRANQAWGLHDAAGQPIPFGEDFLYIMNPAPDSPWTDHLMAEFERALRELNFDGIHLDQYGDPKEGFNCQGQAVDLVDAFFRFINRTKEVAASVRPDTAVVFNAVDNWPIEGVAEADQDFLYIEVWPPHTTYHDFRQLITNAKKLGNGKPVVLAAYISPSRPFNVRLADAVILAGGGFHIELGERGRLLADPYFPKHEAIDDELGRVLRRYYDFAVQFENVLALDTVDTTETMAGRVRLADYPLGYDGSPGTVWAMTRRGPSLEVLHLINLVGLSTGEWVEPLEAGPDKLQDLRIRYPIECEVDNIWLASPDFSSPEPLPIEFNSGKLNGTTYVEFTIPTLEYWDLIVMEKSESKA